MLSGGLTSWMEDFDASLYFLDPKEIEYLRQETDREYGLDLRKLVMHALLDIFELQVDALVREEVAGDLDVLGLQRALGDGGGELEHLQGAERGERVKVGGRRDADLHRFLAVAAFVARGGCWKTSRKSFSSRRGSSRSAATASSSSAMFMRIR